MVIIIVNDLVRYIFYIYLQVQLESHVQYV